MSITVPSGRSAKKHAAIVAAATEVFLSEGYEAASMDEVASRANVSKRTVYNNFPSKRALFGAVIASLYGDLLEVEKSADIAHLPPDQALPYLARTILDHIRKPEIMGLLRLLVAERERVPEAASEFQTSAKGPAVGLVEDYLTRQVAAGTLVIGDPLLAAQQFLGMIKESLFWPRLMGLPPAPGEDAVIAKAMAVFLKMYGR